MKQDVKVRDSETTETARQEQRDRNNAKQQNCETVS